MKLRAIRASLFRRFDAPVAVEGIADGVNVLSGPNEFGKSTIFHVLESALLRRFKVSGGALDAMRPYAGGDPLVEVDFEQGGTLWRIRKQFGRGAVAVLSDVASGRTIARNADAEAQLAEIIGLDGELPGRLGVVWVRQQRALRVPELDVDPDDNGKPRDRGERVALMDAISGEIGAAAQGEAFDAVRQKAASVLDTLLTEKRTGAKRNGPLDLAVRLRDEMELKVADARRAVDAGEARLGLIATKTRELEQLSAPEVIARETQALAAFAVRMADAAQYVSKRDALREGVKAREAELLAARQAAAAADTLARDVAVKRDAVAAARALTLEINRLAAEVNSSVATPARMESLLNLDRDHRIAAAELSGISATVDLALDAEGATKVRIDGAPVEKSARISVPGRLTIEIEGIGTIGVTSAGAERAALLMARKSEAESVFRQALAAFGAATIDVAREMTAARGRSVTELDRARAQLSGIAPQGLDRLQAELAARESEASNNVAASAAGVHIEKIENEVSAARSALSALASSAQSDDALKALEVAYRDAEQAAAQRQRDVAGLELELARLLGEQSGADEDGKAAALGTLEGERDRAREDARRLDQESRALVLLEETLAAVESETRAAAIAPVTKRLMPMLDAVYGPAELLLRDDFVPAGLRRTGPTEPFLSLSDGTREQLSVLVRLAYAALFTERGMPVPVVLDDPFVYSDDERLAALKAVIAGAALNQQILLLTCRPLSFGDLPGRRLAIEPWRPG